MASFSKSVLITGCSAGGIGEGLAEVFSEKGYHVFATVREPAKISETLSNTENVTILILDVLSAESITAAVGIVRKATFGRLDVLVNNAGAGIFKPALDTSVQEGKELFDLNFWAPLAMVQAFAPLLIQAKGYVVNNTSAGVFFPTPFMSVYNASKAALASASETWRREFQPLGVRTLTVVTCAVNTSYFSVDRQVELPENSYYHQVKEMIYGIANGEMQATAVSPRQYATQIVQSVETGAVGTVWAGTNASVVRLLWWLLPQYLFDRLLDSMFPVSSRMAKGTEEKNA